MSNYSLQNYYMYEKTRKLKIYRRNNRMEQLDVGDLLILLKGIDVQQVHLRFYFTRFTTEEISDLLANYPEKILQASLVYSLVHNIPLTIKSIYCDGNNYIFDINCEMSDQTTIRKVLKYLLSHESCSFVSQVEVTTRGERETLAFRLEGIRSSSEQLSLSPKIISSSELVDVLPSVPLQVPIDIDLLDDYYSVLRTYYHHFYQDAANRSCTIWVYRENLGEYIVKRYFQNNLIYFPESYEEVEPFLNLEKVVTIVPNSMPVTSDVPVEMILDLDPGAIPYAITRQVSNQLAQWLLEQDLLFYRRLTGNRNGGQHFIIPVNYDKAFILSGTEETWGLYTQRSPTHVLCDSLRSVAELICLVFQRENKSLARYVTTRVFDPYSRVDRMLLDVSPNSQNRGRRALLSLHQKSLGLCVPFVESSLPESHEDFQDLVALDEALAGHINFEEKPSTSYMQRHNTQKLSQLVDQEICLFEEFYALPRMRFEQIHFAIPVPRVCH
ncbi:MAG: hypothetical protein ACXAC8_04540 [Candidatus Hodarchaeales archaeon]